MNSTPSPSSPPLTPEGFAYAGPVSDFLPETDSKTNDQNDSTSTAAAGCHTTGTGGSGCTAVVEPKEAKDGEKYLIKVIEIPQPAGRYPPQKRVAISYFRKKWYAFINICPHQGSALSRGSMIDIEDMGIVWGAGVACSLHDWTFDALSGQSDSTRFVIDTYDIKEIEGHVFVSQAPRNAHVAGPRRDFGGREMN
ncbi:hypothetical protein BC939DRAFT_495113 [Gamsiella multidivaricata]|uniref:uncharacterized protein n=1 Tax=Gamsiella multidivaricata TaxID=101098 RepID=UPI00221FFC71|nr:uncharacterized protein BC939DRAFT_495113 [Gamsiella multidivaricata]KAI7819595.1 hypothetical protein BC939DRAFT_495113 [Gamsiella multidivaricata]